MITPVTSFHGLPDASVWEPVYQLLYKMKVIGVIEDCQIIKKILKHLQL